MIPVIQLLFILSGPGEGVGKTAAGTDSAARGGVPPGAQHGEQSGTAGAVVSLSQQHWPGDQYSKWLE